MFLSLHFFTCEVRFMPLGFLLILRLTSLKLVMTMGPLQLSFLFLVGSDLSSPTRQWERGALTAETPGISQHPWFLLPLQKSSIIFRWAKRVRKPQASHMVNIFKYFQNWYSCLIKERAPIRKGKEILVVHMLTAQSQKIPPLTTFRGPPHSILPPALPYKTFNTYSDLRRDTLTKNSGACGQSCWEKVKMYSILALPST